MHTKDASVTQRSYVNLCAVTTGSAELEPESSIRISDSPCQRGQTSKSPLLDNLILRGAHQQVHCHSERVFHVGLGSVHALGPELLREECDECVTRFLG